MYIDHLVHDCIMTKYHYITKNNIIYKIKESVHPSWMTAREVRAINLCRLDSNSDVYT